MRATTRVWAGVLTLMVLCGSTASADPAGDTKTTLQQMYDLQALATSLKYIPGIMAHQAPDFELHSLRAGDTGRQAERALYQRLFASSLEVKDGFKVLSVQQKDATHASCEVQEDMEIHVPGATPKAPVTVAKIRSLTHDEWLKTATGWWQESATVRKETMTHQMEKADGAAHP